MKPEINHPMTTPAQLNLTPQMPLPSAAAMAYEETVLGWASSADAGLWHARGIAYGEHPMHKFDVFAAPDTPADAPVLVFFHGGGWTNGYKEYVSFMASHVVAIGCVLVAPSYRLAPGAPLPAAFEDGAALLATLQKVLPAWPRAKAAGGSVELARRVVLAGHSAGGHLAALLALRPDALIRAGADPDHIVGCLPISGIFDLHHPEPAPGSLEARVYDMVLGPHTDDALMSPLCWARGNTVPMVLSWGEYDSHRVARSNQRMASLLATQGGPWAAFVEPHADHFQTHTSLVDGTHAWYRRLACVAHNRGVPRD
ncbi:alpha/beta hydrolase [Pandoraea terrigena]|uniref:Carboxylesterase NlhH n=1 Tax=Pandoraea terrigena TaxID=2508292 RepID=A0A5E4V1N5_9BURK|nr:alpha/beta hydrolase [Pandoraea terrigena]VVE06126.1 Carboxylesterase NlhH [Pandoraea terrigena]